MAKIKSQTVSSFQEKSKYPVQAFILKLKHLALKLVNFIKKPIEGKEDNVKIREKTSYW
jgi:hypothetical protein